MVDTKYIVHIFYIIGPINGTTSGQGMNFPIMLTIDNTSNGIQYTGRRPDRPSVGCIAGFTSVFNSVIEVRSTDFH